MSQLIELTGRKARLAAERDGALEIEFPTDLASFGVEARRVMGGERRLFEAKRQGTANQKGQLRERIGQFNMEIEGLTAQRQAKAHELDLVREELARVSDMYRRGLTPVTRLLAMQREETRIDGEHGTLTAQIGRAGGQISEVELQIITIEQSLRTDAQKELREIEGRIAELTERKVAAEDQLKRVDIRAPISGVVHELAVHTVGGVITAGEPLMLIVPSEDLLTIEVRIAPPDIDQISIGQKCVLRFPAFNQRTTPELPGMVTRVAADLSRDPQSGVTFYLARIRILDAAMKDLKGLKLVPGMPVEAFVETEQRTALSYMLKPLTDQFAKAFREE